MRNSVIFATIVLAISCTSKVNLVPDTPSDAPDYLCTWNLQGYVCSYGPPEEMRARMTERYLFGNGPFEGWTSLYPQIRQDLYFVMDDSWDIPADRNERWDNPYYGTARLDTSRFPSFRGTPEERLNALSDSVKGRGWKGLGGWICAQKADTDQDVPEAVYWGDRLREAQAAGVRYWKVDWGRDDHNRQWRENLISWGRELAPDLTIESAMNPDFIRFSDTYRTYDVENITAQTVTIDRVADLLNYSPEGNAAGIINCEDEPYIAAGLGCAIGIMRHPFVGNLPSGRPDHAFPEAARDLKRRIDEIIRGVRWHRIASPFGSDGRSFSVDTLILEDGWIFHADESWIGHAIGEIVYASAPARVSRGMPLPKVGSDNPDRPFVLASRYPSGSVAVATIGRSLKRSYVLMEVPVEIEIPSVQSKVGVFGRYESLTLRYPSDLSKVRILAQDLAGTEAVDISDRVTVDGSSVVIPGGVIADVGLSAASEGDISDPGLVLVII